MRAGLLESAGNGFSLAACPSVGRSRMKPMLRYLLSAAMVVLVLLPGCSTIGQIPPAIDGNWHEVKPAASALAIGGAPDGIGLDYIAQGIVTVRFQTEEEAGIRIEKGNDSVSYIIAGDGSIEAFPITLGNGDYRFYLLVSSGEGRYRAEETTACSVSLESDTAHYAASNSLCLYSEESDCVRVAEAIAQASEDEAAYIENVRGWLDSNIAYDGWKATFPPDLYTPDPDATLAEGKGICGDIATLSAAMLRSQSIPTRIVIGYVDSGKKHAWNEVYIDGEWETFVTKSCEFEEVLSIIKYQ